MKWSGEEVGFSLFFLTPSSLSKTHHHLCFDDKYFFLNGVWSSRTIQSLFNANECKWDFSKRLQVTRLYLTQYFLSLGHISTQRCIWEARSFQKSYKESADAFIEEAFIRRELSDNFCFYNNFYDSIKGKFRQALVGICWWYSIAILFVVTSHISVLCREGVLYFFFVWSSRTLTSPWNSDVNRSRENREHPAPAELLAHQVFLPFDPVLPFTSYSDI